MIEDRSVVVAFEFEEIEGRLVKTLLEVERWTRLPVRKGRGAIQLAKEFGIQSTFGRLRILQIDAMHLPNIIGTPTLIENRQNVMLVLNSRDVTQALPLVDAINAMNQAFVIISSQDAQNPERIHLDFPDRNGTTLVMPAATKYQTGDALAVKVVSIFDDNPNHGLPRVIGAVLVLDAGTGKPIALLDGSSLTTIRTAAATAAATAVLAREDASILGIIGAGELSKNHVLAICAIRSIERVVIYARTAKSADKLAKILAEQSTLDCRIETCGSANELVCQSEIVCTLTNSSTPVFDAGLIQAGCHINAIGSYKKTVAEIPGDTVAKSTLFVDQVSAALAEAGDITQPIADGLIEESHIRGEIGQVLSRVVPGRSTFEEITMFKSVGNSVQDCIASQKIVTNALKLGIGQSVDF